jgi:hypothetical protein
MQLTRPQSVSISTDYYFLIGRRFKHPNYGVCCIDDIQPVETENGNYEIKIIYQTLRKDRPSWPEIYGFQNVTYDLFKYLDENAIPFNPKKYGIL